MGRWMMLAVLAAVGVAAGGAAENAVTLGEVLRAHDLAERLEPALECLGLPLDLAVSHDKGQPRKSAADFFPGIIDLSNNCFIKVDPPSGAILSFGRIYFKGRLPENYVERPLISEEEAVRKMEDLMEALGYDVGKDFVQAGPTRLEPIGVSTTMRPEILQYTRTYKRIYEGVAAGYYRIGICAKSGDVLGFSCPGFIPPDSMEVKVSAAEAAEAAKTFLWGELDLHKRKNAQDIGFEIIEPRLEIMRPSTLWEFMTGKAENIQLKSRASRLVWIVGVELRFPGSSDEGDSFERPCYTLYVDAQTGQCLDGGW